MLRRSWIAVLMLAAAAQGGITVQTLSPEKVAAAEKSYSVDIGEVSFAEMVAEFTKQTGININTAEVSNRQQGGPVQVMELHFKNVSLLDALDKLGLATGFGVYYDPNNMDGVGRLSFSNPGLQNRRMTMMQPGVKVVALSRNQSIPPNPMMRDGLNLQLSVLPDVTVLPQFEIKSVEAVDDQERPITANTSQSGTFYGDFNNAGPMSFGIFLEPALPLPRMIKSIKGEIAMKRLKSVAVIRDNTAGETCITPYCGGVITIGPPDPKQFGGNGMADRAISIRMDRGAMTDADWNMVPNLMSAIGKIRVYDESGAQLQVMGRSSSSSNTWRSATFSVRSSAVFNPGPRRLAPESPHEAPLKIAKIIWELPKEVEDYSMHFEATDLIVP